MSTTTDARHLLEQGAFRLAPIQQQLRHLIPYAIAAPSTRNTQPWRFAVETNTLCLFADLDRRQPVSDPDRRELYISLGCALENLLVAAECHGLGHEVTYFPEDGNDEFVAHVAFMPGGSPSPARAGITLEALLRRHNDNGIYRPVPLAGEVRQRLEACRQESDLRLELTDDHGFRCWVEALTSQADRLELASPAFRRELGYWIGQGVFGQGKVISGLTELAVTRLDLSEAVARQDEAIVGSAALLGVISAEDDGHLTHVHTGQLFERLWLCATAMGVNVHPMSPVVRVPAVRAALGELLPSRGWVPQHLFRIGYSSTAGVPKRRTPRRPLDDVMLE